LKKKCHHLVAFLFIRFRLCVRDQRLRLRLLPDRLELRPLLERPRLVLFRLEDDRRRRVEAAFRADAEREDFEREAEARPPFLPPFREELRFDFLPRPDPLFLPPPVSLFTVAHARLSASPRETPRFS